MPIFLKSCFLLVLKIWSLLEVWLTSYTRLASVTGVQTCALPIYSEGLRNRYNDFWGDIHQVNQRTVEPKCVED